MVIAERAEARSFSRPKTAEELRGRQADELRHHAVGVFDRVALGPGHEVLDIGCGAGGVLDLLAQRVGPLGRVTGIDQSRDNVTGARGFRDRLGLANVTVMEGDMADHAFPSASFDLVHARLVLATAPQPEHVVADMARLARPGGWVVSAEADIFTLCEPSIPAWDELVEVCRRAYAWDGMDLHVGRRLPELFRAAGLVEVDMDVRADFSPLDATCRSSLLALAHTLHHKIVARGILGDYEFNDLVRTVQAHVDDPDTLILPQLLFMAWGRRR